MRYLRRAAAGAAATCALLSLASVGSASAALARVTDTAATAPHVMVIMMENTDYSQFAIGSPAMPYLNDLAHQYADFTSAYGWRLPEPAQLPGAAQRFRRRHLSNDCDITDQGCTGFTNPTLVDPAGGRRDRWHAYYQGDVSGLRSRATFSPGTTPYWHNVFRVLQRLRPAVLAPLELHRRCCPTCPHRARPTSSSVVPDLVNSGGDNGTMASGDTWLNGAIPQIMNTSWYREGGQIVILYDTGYETPAASTAPAAVRSR